MQKDLVPTPPCKILIALLKRNTYLIKQLRVQLKPYKDLPTKHDVWLRFQGYTRLIVRPGGGGQASGGAAPPSA